MKRILLAAMLMLLCFGIAFTCAANQGRGALNIPLSGSVDDSASEALPLPVASLCLPLEDYSEHTFSVRYIDVGEADAALVACDGHYMLIDGGNAGDSSRIYTILTGEGITHLDYIVNSHPHEDHVGGLAGALNACTVDHVLCPVSSYPSSAFESFRKYTLAQGKSIEIPTAGEQFSLGSSFVKILGPLNSGQSCNNRSIVLRIDYGETSFLFTGDIEREAENDLFDTWGVAGELKSTVLKVAHHGSETSTSYSFLWAVEPSAAIISVGADNSYNHPSESVLSRLSDAETAIYRTDLMGDILITSDGEQVTMSTQRSGARQQEGQHTQVDGDCSYAYIGNLRSHKLHVPSCGSLPSGKNRVYFDTYEEAVSAGYTPCGNCLRGK